MAKLKIQTGWGAELSADARACVQCLRQAGDMIQALNLDPALAANPNIQGQYKKLQGAVREMEGTFQRIDGFIAASMEQYEQLERTLILEAQDCGTQMLLNGSSQMDSFRNLFAGEENKVVLTNEDHKE